MPKVLLTGGSGFIAAHVLELLLKRGYEVLTTVRSETKASQIRAKYPGAKLSVAIVPNIAVPNAFDEVIANNPGIDYVQHTASPFHFKFSDARTELLDPAINGTKGILQAIAKHAPSVKRVVVTSSFAAIISEAKMNDPTTVFSEADWNPSTYEDGLKGPPPTSYRVSKKCAEKAAWDFVEQEKPGFDLATICPPMVFGPVAHHLDSLRDINTSDQRFVDLMQGKWNDEIPASGVFLWVDVRDVALAHLRAMEIPEAGGQRFFTTAGYYDNARIARVVRDGLPDLAAAGKLPGDNVRLAPGAEKPAQVFGYDNSRATKVLGIDWIPLEKSAVDTVKSLLEIPA
ncbi:putative NAD dependent epimerase/dehydratase [Daldinia caldariorum]|uniref:putative NAD dependent epimerase/dehydratase n=1 Tax=Daldinia caldariorum TaxID=326644 RepID=UPI00200818C1|nr:putative NAD dependent epimerase/dehydratase [Daldinia caldariorum]KAI1471949.1 putative NAD dependent epimerase/dehydratase [Daldinia caldariorum]